jgi:hypothetical protein
LLLKLWMFISECMQILEETGKIKTNYTKLINKCILVGLQIMEDVCLCHEESLLLL